MSRHHLTLNISETPETVRDTITMNWNTTRDLHTPYSRCRFRMILSDHEWIAKWPMTRSISRGLSASAEILVCLVCQSPFKTEYHHCCYFARVVKSFSHGVICLTFWLRDIPDPIFHDCIQQQCLDLQEHVREYVPELVLPCPMPEGCMWSALFAHYYNYRLIFIDIIKVAL